MKGGRYGVKVYYFDPDSGVYQGEGFQAQGPCDAEEGVTGVAPPPCAAGEIPVFDRDHYRWKTDTLHNLRTRVLP